MMQSKASIADFPTFRRWVWIREIGVEDIKAMVFAHPTFSEAFYEAALDMSDEAIHILKEGSTSS